MKKATEKIKPLFVIIAAWLLALALLVIVFIKLRIVFR